MAAKLILSLCASMLLVQTITAQCLPAQNSYGCGGGYNAAPINIGGCGFAGYDNIVTPCVAASNGGGFGVSVSSALAPSGIDVQSNNDIAGTLYAAGELPLLAAVTVESNLPTAGSAATTYSCGNGQVGISADSLADAGLSASGYGAPATSAFGLGGYCAGLGSAGRGLGLGGCGAPIARPCGCY